LPTVIEDRRVVDEDVQATELRFDIVFQGVNAFLIGDCSASTSPSGREF
jgi:hypothetical protein